MRQLIDHPLIDGVLLTVEDSKMLTARGATAPVVREILAARRVRKPKTVKDVLANHRFHVKRKLQRMHGPG